jgi:hypothetical protein
MLNFVLALIYLLGSFLALHQSLTSTLGYEFASWITLLSLPLAATASFTRCYRNTQISIWRHLRDNLCLLLIPLLVVCLNELRLGSCGFFSGLAFYLLLPVVSVILVTTVVIFCWRVAQRSWPAVGLFSGIIITSMLFTGGRLLFGVATFAYNPFFGWFPGPIYDAAIAIDSRLVLYRLLVLVMALWWWALGKNRRLVWISSLMILTAFLFENRLGFYTSRSYLREQLSGRITSGSLTLFYDPKTESLLNIENFLDDCRYWIDDLNAKLRTSDKPITIYLYADVASKKRLMGAGYTLIGNPIHRELHLLPMQFPDTTLQHELTHVVAGEFGLAYLGLGRTIGLMEGLAVAQETWWGDFPVHQWAAAAIDDAKANEKSSMLRRDLPSVMQGLAFFRQASQKSYLLSGSFVSYLIDNYGIDKFKKLYRSGDYQSVYAMTLATLLTDWQQWLSQQPLDMPTRQKMLPILRRKSLFEESCPHLSAVWRDLGFKQWRDGAVVEAQHCLKRSYSLSGGAAVDLYGLMMTADSPLAAYGFSKILRDRQTSLPGYLSASAWRELARQSLNFSEPQLAMLGAYRANQLSNGAQQLDD